MSFRIWGSIILIVLGILFWLGKFGYIDFYWSRDWPVVLIAVGIFSLVNYLCKRKKRSYIKNKKSVIDRLDNGEIDADEAIDRLKKM